MHRKAKTFILLLALIVLVAATLLACTPVETPERDNYPILDNEDNEKYLDKTQKEEAIDRAVGSMENLLQHLDTEDIADTGYYVGADMTINTDDGSAFVFRMQANLYTYPYEIKDENGNVITDEDGIPLVDQAKLAKHNELIKKSDIVLEWFDGATNEMLIGFYFDGVNPNSPDPGNILYLNLQGTKRWFPDFGDSVLYQQLIRLITKFNLETVIGSASSDGSASSSLSQLREALNLAVSDNYKRTINGDETTIFFNQLPLTTLSSTVTEYMQGIFSPFEDKLDPLTNKYLGFLFSTLGVAEFKSITSDMEFRMEDNEKLGKEILKQLIMDVSGDSSVPTVNEQTGLTESKTVPYKAHISAEYSMRTSSNIVIDKANYTKYEYGSYEYVGDMYIPLLDLKLDVLLRTDINEVDNSKNQVFMNCRDLATDDLIIGLYYKHETVTKDNQSVEGEFTFIDVEGLQHLYGGVKLEDIGLPKAYRGGFDMADTLAWLFDLIDDYIVIAVDNILYGETSDEDSGQYEKLTKIIMDNITSTMKDENDPSSRATIKMKINVELVRKVLSETSETGVEYTTDQMIQLINRQFNIDLESIASILGLSVKELIDKTYFEVTYDVDSYAIKIEVYSTAEMTKEEIEENGGARLILRLDLEPTHIGEKVKIVFPSFAKFNELEDVMTYSGELDGRFIFASTEEVFLGDLLGSFMGDVRKNAKEELSERNRQVPYNAPYTLPSAATIQFTLVYDQYIREQILESGRWTRTSRSAFKLQFYVVETNDLGVQKRTNIVNVYANDVSFNTSDPVEELGYVWLDYACVENMPKFKVREDIFVKSFYRYMGYDFDENGDEIVLGLTDIVKALMKDSWATFEPEVIRVTTSNETVRNFFNVDKMIATASVRIGFKQRVTDIDQLESEYAMYTVSELSDLESDSVYKVELHDTVSVCFDYGSNRTYRDFYFLYSDDSINIVNGQDTYSPSMLNLFMGVNRDYIVRINTEAGTQRINELVYKREEWEPLEQRKTTVDAKYGVDNVQSKYDADYVLHAVYDSKTGYYIVFNDLGYNIIYDFENNVYIIDVGSAIGYDEDKLIDVLNSSATWYRREIKTAPSKKEDDKSYADLSCLYELGMHAKGWYRVENDDKNNIEYDVLYSPDKNVFVVESAEILKDLKDKEYFGTGDTVCVRTFTSSKGYTFTYDFESGKYYSYIPLEGVGNYQVILYDSAVNYYYAPDKDTYNAVKSILGEARFNINADLDWNKDYSAGEASYGKLDGKDAIWQSFEWSNLTWDDITIAGGLFIAKVTIGKGMMASYSENIVLKIINRTVDTDKWINIKLSEEDLKYLQTQSDEYNSTTVKAPVADNIDIDPYVYLIYKAFYENTYSATLSPAELAKGFVKWYLNKFTVTFKFTIIYNDPSEDTADEVVPPDSSKDNSFRGWAFDDNSQGYAIYKETQINNRATKDSSDKTYVYTIFHGQVIAIGLNVLPRKLSAVYVRGEEERNVYTVDALEKDTFTISTDLIYVFDCEDGEAVLDWSNPSEGYKGLPAIFAKLPSNFEDSDLKLKEGSLLDKIKGENALDIISWTNPVANNVKLVNSVEQEDGKFTVYPFTEKIGLKNHNYTSSFFDLKNYIDYAGKWYTEDWFADEEISIRVDMPDKVIGEHDYTFKSGVEHTDETVKVLNIQVAPYYTEGQTEVGANWGVYYVDPFDSTTWTLPNDIWVHFNGIKDGYSSYPYTVTWHNADGDDATHFVIVDGKYVLKDVSRIPGGYFLYATIGEGDNTLDVKIFVHNLSAYMQEITFLGADHELVSAKYNEASDVVGSLTAQDTPRTKYQSETYTYYVDTYARFTLPSYAKITFKDGAVRTYATDWDKNHAPWVQSTSVEINATLGDALAINEKIYLTVKMEGKVIDNLIIANAETAIRAIAEATGVTPTITVYPTTSTIEVGNVKLTADGLVDLGSLGKKTPYEFFGWLFSDITACFNGDKADIRITDAVDSAILPVFGGFDTQKLISKYTAAYGQGVDIYIGQDDDAHDFTVAMTLIGNDSVEYDESQKAIVQTAAIDPFNSDNTPKYPNGYVIADELNFTVKRKDGTSVYYSRLNGRALPEVWSVACPTQEAEESFWADTNESNRLAGLTPYEQISVISWERLYLGGEIWLSAMLEDSSRVYVRITFTSRDIGDKYHSADDDKSSYKISYGTITIENLYDNYNLKDYIAPNYLPSSVKIGESDSDLVFTGISWKMIDGAEAILAAIDYNGTVGKFEDDKVVIATSTIIGKKVTLYLKILPCKVKALSYDAILNREFRSEDVNEEGTVVLHVDAYKNWAYNGEFKLPESIKLVYDATGRTGSSSDEFTYNNISYVNAVSGKNIVNAIGYNLDGHNLSADESLNSRNVSATITLKDGQVINLLVHFDDKHVTSVSAGTYKDSKYYIDPYSEKITVPQEITVNFKEGDSLKYTAEWTADSEFEVMYDTYQRVLAKRAEPFFLFEAKLSGYSKISEQDLLLKVQVYDRLKTKYEIVDGKQDTYEAYSTPNAYYRYEDPFAGRAEDLPSVFEINDRNYNLVWDFTDADITTSGTYNVVTGKDGTRTYELGYITVYGHVYNAERGQPVAIKVYVDAWQYEQIRRPDGQGGYIIMEGDALRFVISAITGVSAENNYQVSFKRVAGDIEKGVVNVETIQRIFVPEGVSPSAADASYTDAYPYRLYWDAEALNRAKSGEEATGYFALGNENGLEKTQYSPAKYQYERPNIISIDMGYGLGTENNAVYVVNPLNPTFANIKVKATGTYSGQYNVSLDNVGLTVTATWNSTPNVSKYFAGGVIRNQQVTLVMTRDDDSSFYYTQSFNVMLVMLDMSPTSYIGNSAISVLNGARFKTTYNASTYSGSVNPYKDVYVEHLIQKQVERDGVTANVLDTAIKDLGLSDRTLTYYVTEWEDRIYNSNNTKTQYSSKVEVNGRTYSTNAVMRRWNSMYSITGLDLGYGDGFGIDSADYADKKSKGTLTATDKKIVKVVNPLDPLFGEQFSSASSVYETKISSTSVRGTYNGSDISTLGYEFSITWWDTATNGDTVNFGDSYVRGGIADYWKVKVKVYKDGTVVYEQIVNIEMVFLDMTPSGNKFYADEDKSVYGGHGVATYTQNTYQGKQNPYGDEYNSLVAALNKGATGAGIGSRSYDYTVVEWGDYESVFVDGEEKHVRNSELVEITVTLMDGSTKTVRVRTDMFSTEL